MGLYRCTAIYTSIYVTSAKGHIINPCPLLLLAIRNKCVLEAGGLPIQFVRYGVSQRYRRMCVWIIDGAAYAPVKGDRCAPPSPSRSQIHQWLIITCAFTTRGLALMDHFTPFCSYCHPAYGRAVILKWFLIREAHSQSLWCWRSETTAAHSIQ